MQCIRAMASCLSGRVSPRPVPKTGLSLLALRPTPLQRWATRLNRRSWLRKRAYRSSPASLGKLKTQIGRASGRERVCQYGWISVVAVALKKTKKKIDKEEYD